MDSNWGRLLDVYAEIEEDPFWDYLRGEPGSGIKLVKGDGPESCETAKIMVVGEAPGATENGAGKPFAGVSGSVVDQGLELMGYGEDQSVKNVPFRSKVFVTNVVKYRPPGNATPSDGAVLHATESLRQEFKVVRPRLVICIGATAHLALHPQRGIMSLSQCRVQPGVPWAYRQPADRIAGKPYNYCISMYHPAWALRERNPEQRKRKQELIERDWEALGDWLREFEPDVLA